MTPQMENMLIQYLGWTGGPPFFISKKNNAENIFQNFKKIKLSEFFLPFSPNFPVYSYEKSLYSLEGK